MLLRDVARSAITTRYCFPFQLHNIKWGGNNLTGRFVLVDFYFCSAVHHTSSRSGDKCNYCSAGTKQVQDLSALLISYCISVTNLWTRISGFKQEQKSLPAWAENCTNINFIMAALHLFTKCTFPCQENRFYYDFNRILERKDCWYEKLILFLVQFKCKI